MVVGTFLGEIQMIATEAALYGGSTSGGAGITTLVVCSCGQEIGSSAREHCPRCGCVVH
jgi:hypothetical protein